MEEFGASRESNNNYLIVVALILILGGWLYLSLKKAREDREAGIERPKELVCYQDFISRSLWTQTSTCRYE